MTDPQHSRQNPATQHPQPEFPAQSYRGSGRPDGRKTVDSGIERVVALAFAPGGRRRAVHPPPGGGRRGTRDVPDGIEAITTEQSACTEGAIVTFTQGPAQMVVGRGIRPEILNATGGTPLP